MSLATITTVGTEAEAEMLSRSKRGELPGPDWTMIGSGSYRQVFLSPSGVAYKRGVDHCNETEDMTSKRCADLEPWENTRIPQTTLYRFDGMTILAMEFVKGVLYQYSDLCECDYKYCHKCYELYNGIQSYYGVSDMHPYNIVVTEDNLIYVIDLGND